MSPRYLAIEGVRPGEYYFLVLCATLGMMFMAGGIDLITLFIGLETMAVSFYVLAGYLRPNRRSNEAAIKYFLLGAFSLAILLYGMSLLYGLTGSTHLRTIATALAAGDGGLLLPFAVMLLVAGHRVQDCGRAVSHVGARRVRRGADADHRVPLGRIEDRGVRDAAADLRRRPAGVPDGRARLDLGAAARVERVLLRARGGDDDRREHRGADAGEHQADARVLVDRARRLRAHRHRRRHAARHHRGAGLPDGLRVHAAGRVRRRRPDAARRTSSATS